MAKDKPKKVKTKLRKKSMFDLDNVVKPEEKNNDARGNPRTNIDKQEVDKEMESFDRIFK